MKLEDKQYFISRYLNIEHWITVNIILKNQ